MADLLERFFESVQAQSIEWQGVMHTSAASHDDAVAEAVRDNWFDLPSPVADEGPAAYAVDGSIRQVTLENGCRVLVTQALCLGQNGFELGDCSPRILPSDTPKDQMDRFADLLQRNIELTVALDAAEKIPPGSVLYLDGALYGLLPQLFVGSNTVEKLRQQALANYLALMATVKARSIQLIAVSKTSRLFAHFRLWQAAKGATVPDLQMSDLDLIHQWTDQVAGLSLPVVLGTHPFEGGSNALLDIAEVAASPSIVSFFIRLADYDGALRIDVPGHQAGDSHAIGAIEGAVLAGGADGVRDIARVLMADYGGSEVYNALLYSVDRQVRLRRDQFVSVYLPMIQAELKVPIRPNRSDRRFL